MRTVAFLCASFLWLISRRWTVWSRVAVAAPYGVLALAVLSVVPGASFAQEQDREVWTDDAMADVELQELGQYSLEELLNMRVVTDSKDETDLKRSVAIMTVFTRDDIVRLGAKTLIELLEFVPGFFPVASPWGPNVAIRGIHAAMPQHLVVLIDGLPDGDFLTSSAPLATSLSFVERVEVIRGPGSALYGGNALVGVINLITRSAKNASGSEVELTLGEDQYIGASILIREKLGDVGGVSFSASLYQDKGNRSWVPGSENVLLPSRGVNNSDGIQDTETYTLPTRRVPVRVGRQGLGADLLARFDGADGLTIRLAFQNNDTYPQRNYRNHALAPKATAERPRYMKRRFLLDLEQSWGNESDLGRLSIRPSLVAGQHRMVSSRVGFSSYDDSHREGKEVVYGLSGNDVRLGVSIDYFVDLPDLAVFRSNVLLVGTQTEFGFASDFAETRCFQDASGRFSPSPYSEPDERDLYCIESVLLNEGMTLDNTQFMDTDKDHVGNGDQLSSGIYAQMTSEVAENVRLVSGARFDYREGLGWRVSPRVAASMTLPWNLHAKAQFAIAFVNPAFLYRQGNALSHYEGNPSVEPQSIRTMEALVGYSSRYFNVEAGAYLSVVDDFITFDLTNNARTGNYRFDNQGRVAVQGLEASSYSVFFDGMVRLQLGASLAVPLDSTDDQFVAADVLAGPSKYPFFVGDAVLSLSPSQHFSVSVTLGYNSQVDQIMPVEITFQDIRGADGTLYSSKAAKEYNTGEVPIVGLIGVATFESWRFTLMASNILDKNQHRPGSVLTPYRGRGRRVLFTGNYLF